MRSMCDEASNNNKAELLKLEVKLGKAVKHMKQKAQNKRN